MKDSQLYLFSAVFFCIFSLHHITSAQTPSPTPEIISNAFSIQEAETNLIHPGDLIDVDVIGSVEYDWRGKLNPEGFLDGIDFVENPIYGFCQTEEAVAEAVSKAYGKILRDPKVMVRVLDRSNRPLSLLYGAVKNPQRLQIQRPVRLSELIILAGGLTDKASGEIQIYRPPSLNCRQQTEKISASTGNSGENRERFVLASQDNGSNYINIRIIDLLKGKKEANPQVLSGDIVTVQEADSIYIIGGVANPKQISSRAQMTLSRAIDSAGGIIKSGDAKKITIFRREAGESKIIEADLEKIKSSQADDVILKAFDIVEVAQRGSEKRKFPPVLKAAEVGKKNSLNLPLRIID